MNYFAHGREVLDQPYVLAGVATPDWLNVVDRRMKTRRVTAEKFLDDSDQILAQVARGIVLHHDDDRWFHQTRAFAELSLAFTVQIRDLCRNDPGMRPSFLGHILVELLLDAHLIELNVDRLDRYYESMSGLAVSQVATAINRIATKTSVRLESWIQRFCLERFLYDYLGDEKLLWRVNQVMNRVGLQAVPEEMVDWLPGARRDVTARAADLLTKNRND
jgi:hypothetical protein